MNKPVIRTGDLVSRKVDQNHKPCLVEAIDWTAKGDEVYLAGWSWSFHPDQLTLIKRREDVPRSDRPTG